MNQLQAAKFYRITPEQVYSIDMWFLQSPIPLKDINLLESLPHMSKKLNISAGETLELLQSRLDAVAHTKRLNKIIKWVIIIAIGTSIAYFTK